MEQLSKLALKAEIEQLVFRYWRHVDTCWGAEAHNFFTVEGVFESENMRLEGREEIRSFYDWRRRRGERVARHIVNNMLVSIDDDHHAVATYILTIFAGDGVPVLPVSSPNLISDVTEKVAKTADTWLIEQRSLKTLFKGDAPATVMPAEVLAGVRQGRRQRKE